ncbi:hypothetical protein [Oceanisphaera avium]|uniref:Oxidoreductase molybdopterin-binding domain-containing protein n=1 Tax=Oceanisphaera avium TaxID=1903694 RepID=A0A1Y0CW13_9GAMM|nr:hypothetical protein [Oceanisphaera avium]ART79492.1 hypothetical protein CBP12_04450 [Oceanisphaera avium]
MLIKPIKNPFALASWLLGGLIYSVALIANAQTLPALDPPQGRVILTITGDIKVSNSTSLSDKSEQPKAEFDLAMLDALEQHEFTTKTPWTNGAHQFSGVLLKEVLERVGATGHHIKAIAYNEYFAEIDTHDLELEQLLVTTRLDGKEMRIRDKGPTWLMLPLSDLKELNNKRYHELLIWQLKTLDVQ